MPPELDTNKAKLSSGLRKKEPLCAGSSVIPLRWSQCGIFLNLLCKALIKKPEKFLCPFRMIRTLKNYLSSIYFSSQEILLPRSTRKSFSARDQACRKCVYIVSAVSVSSVIQVFEGSATLKSITVLEFVDFCCSLSTSK